MYPFNDPGQLPIRPVREPNGEWLRFAKKRVRLRTFFEQCQHRMACAKCDFYMPKESTAGFLLEGKTHLLRLLQEIPLGEAEQAAVEDGVTAYENLLSKLTQLPQLRR